MAKLGSLGLILEDEKTGKLELREYSLSDYTYVKSYLVCDLNTKVVYYSHRSDYGNSGINYICPYISENGKYCRFIDGKIVEIG